MNLNWVTNLILWVAFSQTFWFSDGYKFFVGGRNGWVLHPSEDYSKWAERNRFVVNDTLYFKYKKGEDSVLEVNKDDYYNCNNSSWVLKKEDGFSEFRLDRSGPFFFISGVKDRCDKGQILLIIVLSEHHGRAASAAAQPPATTPSPATSPAAEPSLSPSRGSAPHSPASPSYPYAWPASPPEEPGGDGSPAAAPSPKAEASRLRIALLVSVGSMVCSSVFLGAIQFNIRRINVLNYNNGYIKVLNEAI